MTQLLLYHLYLKIQKSHYLTSSIWPCYLIDDEGIGIQVPQTLSDVGTHTRTGAACNTHHDENPSQTITALHLHPNQILHSLFMTWSMNTEPSENNNKHKTNTHLKLNPRAELLTHSPSCFQSPASGRNVLCLHISIFQILKPWLLLER